MSKGTVRIRRMFSNSEANRSRVGKLHNFVRLMPYVPDRLCFRTPAIVAVRLHGACGALVEGIDSDSQTKPGR